MKSVLKTLAVFILAASINCSVSAKVFFDLEKTHWAYSQIQSLSNDGVVIGYPDGSFKPDQPVTRAEFATMVVKALRQENCILNEIYYFNDVPQNYWAYDMIQKAQSFDLLKGYPDGSFKPDENIAKVDAVSMMIASVETSDITEIQAKKALKIYKDADSIPVWAIINAGKAEKLTVTAHNPQTPNLFEPDRKITRAEVAVSLYNMRKQALKRPNPKLAEAMKPKKAQGIVIDPVYIDSTGTIATIPEGTLLPVTLLDSISSQKNAASEMFVTEAKENLVTKENYLLIAKGSYINGEIIDIKPARYFWRNARVILEAKSINTVRRQKADLPGRLKLEDKKYKWYQKAVNFVIRGRKITLNKNQQVLIRINKPIKVDLTNGAILN